jgi:hypothetical protein
VILGKSLPMVKSAFLATSLIPFLFSVTTIAGTKSGSLPSNKKTYSAFESGAENLPADFNILSGEPAPAKAAPVTVNQESKQKTVPSKKPKPSFAYDPVPDQQAVKIAKRLAVVDQLIRRHRRAYDYRTHTVTELEGILTELDRSKLPVPTESDERGERIPLSDEVSF